MEVIGWQNSADFHRPFEDRVQFSGYPHNEATYKAFKNILAQSEISREELMQKGVFQIHDAFGPLMLMTLMEMGYLNSEDFSRSWQEMGDFSKKRINPMGGLRAGHPLGATALVRLHEAMLQFSKKAPADLQIDEDLTYALIQSVYGPRDQISMTLLKALG